MRWDQRWALASALDMRSLAVWRVAAGLLILIDLAWRAFDLEAFYTDRGVLPRSLLSALPSSFHPNLSLHALSGDARWQLLLFGVAGLCAIGLILGWRTRLMVFLSWALLTSLHARNPLALYRGDAVLRLMLFWSMWLPLGAVASLDQRQGRQVKQLGGGALPAIAALVQLSLLYWVSLLHKRGDSWGQEGLAVYYALHLDDFVTPLGAWIREQLALTRALTWGTLAIEFLAPLLLWSPWRPQLMRSLAIALGFGLHVGLLLTMRLDLFMWIMLAVWLMFVPSTWWDRLLARRPPMPEAPLAPMRFARGQQALILALLLMCGIWAYREASPQGRWTQAEALMLPLGLAQRWSMFAPDPSRDDGWIRAQLGAQDEREVVDLLRPQDRDLSKKPARLDTYNLRWRAYLMAVERDAQGELRARYGAWLCAQWLDAGGQPAPLNVRFEVEYTMPPGQSHERWLEELWSGYCDASTRAR